MEKQIEMDYILNQFSKTKVNKMKPVIRCILRMGVYQLKYMDSVPSSAACNESVRLEEGISESEGICQWSAQKCQPEFDENFLSG